MSFYFEYPKVEVMTERQLFAREYTAWAYFVLKTLLHFFSLCACVSTLFKSVEKQSVKRVYQDAINKQFVKVIYSNWSCYSGKKDFWWMDIFCACVKSDKQFIATKKVSTHQGKEIYFLRLEISEKNELNFFKVNFGLFFLTFYLYKIYVYK